MSRYRLKHESLYEQLAETYEAASIVGVSRHFTKYDRLRHDSGLDFAPISVPPSAIRVKRHYVPPTPSIIDMDTSTEESKKYVTDTAEGLKYRLKVGMDNLSAKMANAGSNTKIRNTDGHSTYFTDKYVAPEFFESAIPISSMMRPK